MNIWIVLSKDNKNYGFPSKNMKKLILYFKACRKFRWFILARFNIFRAENTEALSCCICVIHERKHGGVEHERALDVSRNSTCAVISLPCSIFSNTKPAYGGACNFRLRDKERKKMRVSSDTLIRSWNDTWMKIENSWTVHPSWKAKYVYT